MDVKRLRQNANGTHTVPDAIPWRFGHRFVGWQLPGGSVIYHPGDKLQGAGDMRLVAVWEADHGLGH